MKKNNIHIKYILIICLFTTPLVAQHFAIISIPKSGTFLLVKTVKLLSGIKTHIDPKGWDLITPEAMNVFLKKPILLRTHAIHLDQNITQLNNKSIKTVFIYRDPRDQIVSAAYFIKKPVSGWPIHSKWSISELIDELIIGGGLIWKTIFSAKETWHNLQGITEYYNLYLPWQFEPNVYTTTFEKLVGPQGGGTKEEQLHEIRAISKHMGEEITLEKAEIIAKNLFGNTQTFREGKIGSWKKHFSEQQKEAFKKIAGQLLIDLGYEKDLNW